MEERKEEKEEEAKKSKIEENSGSRHVELKSHTIPPFTGVEPPVSPFAGFSVPLFHVLSEVM